MNILAMAIASTFNSQRKYLRWHLKVLAFFTGVIDKKSITNGYPFSHCLKLIRTNSVWVYC